MCAERGTDRSTAEGAELQGRGRFLRRQQCRQLRAGLGALHGQHREFLALGDCHVEGHGLLAYPGQVLVASAGIHDQAEVLFIEEVGDQVIEDAAILAQQAAVERLAGHGEARHIVGQQVAQEFTHALTREIDHAHVRDVEHARTAAHRLVLLDLRTVVDRQIPSAEIDHVTAEGGMQIKQRRFQSQALGSRPWNRAIKKGRPLP